MLRIISILLLTLLATISLRSQCNNDLEINVLSTFCVPNSDGDPEYYVYFAANQSLGTTSFYNYFIGSPAVSSQHPYELPHVVGPVNPSGEGIILVIVDGQNPNCTASQFISIADLSCAPLECTAPPLTLEIEQASICPGEAIEYTGADPDLYAREGFQVTEQLSTNGFVDNTSTFGTVGGRANPSIYAQPNTWYYVRLVYSLVNQNGPQVDFDCTIYSNIDSFYVGGIDLSHIQNGYDLDCISSDPDSPLELTAVLEGALPPVIIWSRNGAPFSTQNTVVITQTGVYTLSITDASGCNTAKDITVGDQGITNLPTEFTIQGCEGERSYCLFPFQDNWTVQWPEGVEHDGPCALNLTEGEDYIVTFTNEFGCSETVTYTVNPPIPSFISAEAVSPGNCQDETLVIYIENNSQFGDVIEVFIASNDGNFFLTESYFESGEYVIADIPPGTYLIDGVTVFGCFIEGNTVTISSGRPTITNAIVNEVSCNGGSEGSIELEVTGGQMPYTYSWSHISGDGGPLVANLPGGTYSVTISDVNGCATEANYEIFEAPPLEIELINLENATCGSANGLIEIAVFGGSPSPNNDYTTFWSNGWDTELNQFLTAGDYTVTVIDINGCELSQTFTIEDTALEVIIDATLPFIGCGNESVQLFANPVQDGSSIAWFGPDGFSADQAVITITEPGEYTLQILDANGCEGTSSIVIGDERQAPTITTTAVPLTCDVAGSVAVALEDISSEATLSFYLLSQGGDTRTLIEFIDFVIEPTYSFNNLSAGTYEVVVTTEFGCQSSALIEVENQTSIELLSSTVNNIMCPGEAGSIDVTFANPENLSFFWSYQNRTTEDLTDIQEPGLITLTVTDGLDCTALFTFNVNSLGGFLFAEVLEEFPACDGNTGLLCVAIEGQGPFSFEWENGSTSVCQDNLTPGTYSVTVTDVNGCSVAASGTLTGNPEIEVVTSNVLCDGTLGTMQVLVPNPELAIELQILGPNGLFFLAPVNGQSVITVTNAPAETYTLVISYPNDCSATTVVVIENESTLGEVSFIIQDPSCFNNDGRISIETSNPVPGATYLWSNGATTQTIEGLAEGQYFVTVNDGNDCAFEGSVRIISNPFYDLVLAQPNCGLENGSITIIEFPDHPIVSVQWSNGETGLVIDNLSPGEYGYTITSAQGCEDTQSFNLTNFSFAAEIEQFGELNCGSDQVELIAFPEGPYSYLWSGPNNFTSTDQAIGVGTPGIYVLVITNLNNGCARTLDYELAAGNAGFSVSLSIEPAQDCNEFVVLRPTYTPEYEDNQLGHQWITPDGEVYEFPIGGFAVSVPGLYTYTATDLVTGCTVSASIFVPQIGENCHNLSGRLFADEGNCIYDGTEIIVPNWRVEIEATNGTFSTTAFTDGAGQWNANVPLGTFTVRALPYVEPLYTECVPLQTVTVTNGSSAVVDVLMPYVEECPSMYANVSIPFLRRCFENDFYVFYCNDGPVVAENAQLVVEMDPFLDFIEANIVPSSIAARTVTFDLGDLPPFFCGSIRITALASCDAELGQTHCVEVIASPNDPCPVPSNWNGANLEIEADCDGDEVTFSIKNTGTSPMSVPLQYIVIEDGIMLMEGPEPGPVLDAGASFEFMLPADGSTYYVQSNQEPGNPAFSMPTLVVEGCGVNEQGFFTTGLVNNLPLGDNSTNWYDISCRDNVGAYDPNTKEGFPLGFGDRNYIAEGTKLTYDIYFQNTGTDTAFTVVIRDTLAAELDPKTVRMGASSHDYVADLDSNNVLTITFNNILLPDSTTDLAGSQGVVQFTIDHTIGLPMETEIRNDADIYFDFNEPIRTDETLHTLGDDFLPTEVRDIVVVTGGLAVYPNPTKDQVNFTLDLPGVGPYQLRLYDAFGRELRTQSHTELTGSFDLSGLPRGWYLLRGENEGKGARAAVRILLQ